MALHVDPSVRRVLERLERDDNAEGVAGVPKSERVVRCISRAAAELLHALVLATRPRSILELGTSVGYSTLWLATAARRVGGEVVTLERVPAKADRARANIAEAGLDATVTVIEGEVPAALDSLDDRRPFDLLFVDIGSDLYATVFQRGRAVVRPGGLMFFDGSGKFANWARHPDLLSLQAAVDHDPGVESVLLRMEKGYLLVVVQEVPAPSSCTA